MNDDIAERLDAGLKNSPVEPGKCPSVLGGQGKMDGSSTVAAKRCRTLAETLGGWHSVAVSLFAVGALFAIFSRTIADPDLWGHIRFGQDLLKTGQVIRPDIYSYLGGEQVWVNHEWMAEGILAIVYGAFGARGLIAFKLIVVLSIAVLVLSSLRRYRLSDLRCWIIIFIASIPLLVGLTTIRPHMFTYLCLSILMYTLFRAEQGSAAWLWGLPLLFVIWTNLHGGFLAGVGILGIWLFSNLAERLFQPAKSCSIPIRIIAMTVVVSVLATLLNPYGLNLWSFLLRTATVARPEITEWAPIRLISPSGAAYLALLFMGTAALALSTKPKTFFSVTAFVVLGLLPVIAVRHLPLLAAGMLFVTGGHLADIWERRFPPRPSRMHPLLTVGLLLGAIFLFATAYDRGRGISVKETFFPVHAVKLLIAGHAEGNMAVEFNWGEYVIWHLGPKVRVSVDGRRETVYSDDRYREAMNFLRGHKDWNAVLKHDGVSLALVNAQRAAYNLLVDQQDWELLREDSISALFARRESAVASRIKKLLSADYLPETGPCTFP